MLGTGNWNRTSDARIFGPPLYQLSYPGMEITSILLKPSPFMALILSRARCADVCGIIGYIAGGQGGTRTPTGLLTLRLIYSQRSSPALSLPEVLLRIGLR